MLCRALLAAVAVTYLICVLVLSGMQKEDLDVNLLMKLQRHNINANDINNDKVRQDCQLNASNKIIIMKTRKNNDNSSVHQNITSTANTTVNMDNSNKTDINNSKGTTQATIKKDVPENELNNTKHKNPYEVGATKDHNIKTRSSANDVNSTQVAQLSEAMTFFGDQKNLDSVMNMLQTLLKAKLVDNNNTDVLLKSSTFTQITTIPPIKSTEMTTEKKSTDTDTIKVLATFVFNKPIPVDPRYKLDYEKNAFVSKLLNNIEPKYANTNQPEEYVNDDTKTTELFSEQDYMSYNIKAAETTSSVDDDNKPTVQSNLLVDKMMKEFRTKSKLKPTHTLEYEKNESVFGSSQSENLYFPDLKNIVKSQSTRDYDQQRQFDDYEYSKLVDIIKPNKSGIDKNKTAKRLHPDVIKEIADKVKEVILRDLKKEIMPSTVIVSTTEATTQKITTINPKLEKNQNHIQQATRAIQKFVELLEQLKSAKDFIVSPAKYDSSKEEKINSNLHVDATKKGSRNQITPENKTPNNHNDCKTMISGMSNVATVNEYKMPKYNVPMQYHEQYPIMSYYDNMSNKLVPPLMNNPYGVQQPGSQAVINVPQGMPHTNKLNTINIITPVNHTPVININQMRPAPIMIQTSKEIPPLGIPVSMPASLNRNIVMPMRPSFMDALNETEKQRWTYIMKYHRNPDTRGELTNLKNKLTQYTNYKNTPTKQGLEKREESLISNFSSTNKQDKLPDYTKFSLPTITVREHEKQSESPAFSSLLDLQMSNLPSAAKQEQERLIDFKDYNLPNLNVREADRTSSSKTFKSLDKQEREKMIDPTLTTDQTKDTTIKKLNTNDKQQQVYDDGVLSDIKSKLLYNDRYKTDNEYLGLIHRQPLTSRMPDPPKHEYYDRTNVYNPRFLEASANYPNIDIYVKRDHNDFSMRGPYRERIDLSKSQDLYVPRKDPVPKQIPDIKGFHEKLERGDYYEKRMPANVNGWYENPNIPRKYDVNTIKHDETGYSKTNIESRQQLPLTGGTRMSKFDDTHFKNFLKTQQKVNDMLERILATKTNLEYVPSVETT